MIDWIKIEDKIPPKGVKVLILMPRYSYVCTGQYHGQSTKYDEEDVCFLEEWSIDAGDDTYEPTFPISHWAELNFPS